MQPALPLAVAVIGCGAHGRGHVLHFNELPEARVVAVADTERERARGVAGALARGWRPQRPAAVAPSPSCQV